MYERRIVKSFGLFVVLNVVKGGSECPEGFRLNDGHIPGDGQIKSEDNLSLEECGALCLEEITCCSLEYNKESKKCNLNWDYRPYNLKAGQTNFCSKTSDGKRLISLYEESCMMDS